MLLHTKKWVSLSLEEKACILKYDEAAHKKQQQSLSSKNKAHILQKDADAHRKQQEGLSPEEKAQIVKNKTAAQHKHCKSLSPQQKGQVLTIDAANDQCEMTSTHLEWNQLLNIVLLYAPLYRNFKGSKLWLRAMTTSLSLWFGLRFCGCVQVGEGIYHKRAKK